MNNQTANSKGIIINYGLLLGILSIALSVIMYITNNHLQPGFISTAVSFLVTIVIIVLGINAFKKANGTFLSLSQALKVGLGIALIAGILGGVWQLLLVTVIEPEFLTQIADLQREEMMQRFPNMSESQMNDALEMSQKFSSPWIMMAMAIIGSLFFGFLISLVAGLIMKKKNPYEA